MNFFLRYFQLGGLFVPNILCAPLAGYTDQPWRQIYRKFFSGLMFCEMVKMQALVRKIPETWRYLNFSQMERPIGAQIYGSDPALAASSAQILEDLGFDALCLNCGCPVKKIVKDGSGSALLKNPKLLAKILSNMTGQVKIPVVLKIRTGWDVNSVNALEITKIAEESGAKALIIHGRTRSMGYRGQPDLITIRKCKEKAGIPVIGNGGLFSKKDVEKMFLETGCDGVMLARGIIGQPQFFLELTGNFWQMQKDKVSVIKKVLLEHFLLIQKYRFLEDHKAVCDMRRLIGWYLKFCSKTRELKQAVFKAASSTEILHLIENYPWDKMVYQNPVYLYNLIKD